MDSQDNNPNMISKAAILLFRQSDATKELLFVRARNKPYFVLPGGKLAIDEAIEDGLQREVSEELGTSAEDLMYIGKVAGNTPDGRQIEEHLYTGTLSEEPKPQSEIEELIWLDRSAILHRRNDMTPLTLDKILPFIDAQQLW